MTAIKIDGTSRAATRQSELRAPRTIMGVLLIALRSRCGTDAPEESCRERGPLSFGKFRLFPNWVVGIPDRRLFPVRARSVQTVVQRLQVPSGTPSFLRNPRQGVPYAIGPAWCRKDHQGCICPVNRQAPQGSNPY